jgi:acylphosphatase
LTAVTPLVKRLRITGRVQGVGFRWFAREEARTLGLAGWVQNEPAGAVLLEVCGEADAVAAFVNALHLGPPGARVDAVFEEPTSTAEHMLPRPFAVHR